MTTPSSWRAGCCPTTPPGRAARPRGRQRRQSARARSADVRPHPSCDRARRHAACGDRGLSARRSRHARSSRATRPRSARRDHRRQRARRAAFGRDRRDRSGHGRSRALCRARDGVARRRRAQRSCTADGAEAIQDPGEAALHWAAAGVPAQAFAGRATRRPRTRPTEASAAQFLTLAAENAPNGQVVVDHTPGGAGVARPRRTRGDEALGGTARIARTAHRVATRSTES